MSQPNAVIVCAQYAQFPYLTRKLRFVVPQDVDLAAATYAHFKGDEGRDYQRVWWFREGKD